MMCDQMKEAKLLIASTAVPNRPTAPVPITAVTIYAEKLAIHRETARS